MGVHRHTPTQWEIAKTEGDTSQLYDNIRYNKVTSADKSVLIGHNRSKTIGDTKHQNAHPFSFENIVGVHNGTLPWDCRRRIEDDGGHKFDTDSQAMYSHMNANGIEKTIKLMQGAWALVWYDKRNTTLNFLRNKERPLVYCFDDAGKVMFWASEVAMLYLALNRHGVEFGNNKDSKPFYLTEDTLLSWEVPKTFNSVWGKPERKKMEAPKSFTTSYSMGTGSRTFMETHTTASSSTNWVAARERLEERRRNSAFKHVYTGGPEETHPVVDKGRLKMSCLIHADPPYYFGHAKTVVYDREQFEKLMLEGCTVCLDVPTWGEPVKFLSQDKTFVCASCMLLNKDKIHETAAALM